MKIKRIVASILVAAVFAFVFCTLHSVTSHENASDPGVIGNSIMKDPGVIGNSSTYDSKL